VNGTNVIIHLRDLSSPHQIFFELHRKLALWGRVQHIEIGTAELASQDTEGEEKKGDHFFTSVGL